MKTLVKDRFPSPKLFQDYYTTRAITKGYSLEKFFPVEHPILVPVHPNVHVVQP